MPKKIKQVSPMWHGHLMLHFEDGTQLVINRGEHAVGLHATPGQPEPKIGSYWPPIVTTTPPLKEKAK